MVELRIPDNVKLLAKEKVLSMGPKDRERYYSKVILDILKANREGATASEIADSTGFYERTIRDHLEKLEALGEIYSTERGKLTIYYTSGYAEEKPLTVKSKRIDGVYYVITGLKNANGDFIYIQHKEMDEYRALRVKGGIMIAKEDIQDFIKQLHTYTLKEIGKD